MLYRRGRPCALRRSGRGGAGHGLCGRNRRDRRFGRFDSGRRRHGLRNGRRSLLFSLRLNGSRLNRRGRGGFGLALSLNNGLGRLLRLYRGLFRLDRFGPGRFLYDRLHYLRDRPCFLFYFHLRRLLGLIRIWHGICLGMLACQALLFGLFFLRAALLFLASELRLQLSRRLRQFIRAFAHGRHAAQHVLSALEQFLGGILEFHFGHCTACTPA